ncbi:hypothetical protein H257_16749 [Aphanomyces astaci]|uniref:Uncharacterized protein n=1 Tax=Aphanomyces astaci TaxID=112090 RepID=W4FJC5_APHAT|nr:hypothetical protein H257_16749 [Aphanomyces astaci]ETV66949.1 hypothetical protein H257_16749 [Aphanomyces astaci]|eukprot:XP_009843590.1 hypothetical protein H257_16749 [Aphanomyces astaci]
MGCTTSNQNTVDIPLSQPPLAPDQDRLQHETVTFDNNSQPTVVDSDHTLLDHDRLQHEAATFDNNSQPTVVDSDHTLFQPYSESSCAPPSPKQLPLVNRPPPETLRTTMFIANELGQYPDSAVDNIWSEASSGALPPPTTLGSGINIWAIQSMPGPHLSGTNGNIWESMDPPTNDHSKVGPGWQYTADDTTYSTTSCLITSEGPVQNVWSHIDSSVSSNYPRTMSSSSLHFDGNHSCPSLQSTTCSTCNAL